jgi:hypothetical protein
MNPCECGCGEQVARRYVRGHNARVEREALTIGIQQRNTRHSGARHPRWLGTEADYKQLHKWVNRKRQRTGTCVECGATPPPAKDGRAGTDWSNISGQYLRELSDYRELCHPCNMAER